MFNMLYGTGLFAGPAWCGNWLGWSKCTYLFCVDDYGNAVVADRVKAGDFLMQRH